MMSLLIIQCENVSFLAILNNSTLQILSSTKYLSAFLHIPHFRSAVALRHHALTTRSHHKQRLYTLHKLGSWQQYDERFISCHEYSTPLVSFRLYSTEKSPSSASNPGSDIPIHLVNSKIDLTQSVKHVESVSSDNNPSETDNLVAKDEKKSDVEEDVLKTESVANVETEKSADVTADKEQTVETAVETQTTKSVVYSPQVIQPGFITKSWTAFKDFLRHNYDGCKLLFIEVKISARLSKKIFRGESLTRREQNQVSILKSLWYSHVS